MKFKNASIMALGIVLLFIFACKSNDYFDCQMKEMKKLFASTEMQNDLDDFSKYLSYYYYAFHLPRKKQLGYSSKETPKLSIEELNEQYDIYRQGLIAIDDIKSTDDSIKYYKNKAKEYLNLSNQRLQWLISMKGENWTSDDYAKEVKYSDELIILVGETGNFDSYFKKTSLRSADFDAVEKNCSHCKRELTVSEMDELRKELFTGIRENLIDKMGEKYRVMIEEYIKIIE